ncbi:MAG TPA: hydantoinase/oxoprolinase family protein [Tepidisphaeraceae bacterium]|jgi:N-methylhydantoinase A|nr:hydantoinase/oxoprolinase family protein [Tepidisphaeraceae bacterium]
MQNEKTDRPLRLRIGIDVGGTFTDLVATDGTSLHVVKLPSTPPDFQLAVIEAVRQASVYGSPAEIIHGSTVATNALLQRAGEPVAFVTTDGFADMLLIGRQNRPILYALRVQRPEPLTPAENWFTVRERIGADGAVVEPLTEPQVDELIRRIQSRGLRHVAVCLLFSFINPAHEQYIGMRCERAGLTVSLSSRVLPEFREFERASTTVINAAMRPVVTKYLEALEAGLRANQWLHHPDAGSEGLRRAGPNVEKSGSSEYHRTGVVAEQRRNETNSTRPPAPSPGTPGEGQSDRNPHGRGDLTSPGVPEEGTNQNASPSLKILHSGGGVLSVADACAQAARLVLSGPAGGVMGAAFVAKHAGFDHVITYDMGGTSTDVAVIRNGQPAWTTASTIDGLPLGLPMFDIQTVGAGGGSIARVDPGGALRVGPQSAGAIPGPACYDRGGVEPTVTDANLVLGRIVPDRFLGGNMRINPALAHRAIATLASVIGKTVHETALGVVKVAEANMEHAIRSVSSRRGHDPRDFTLVSFGGAGGLHACALADALEIPRVLIPPYCGVLSALGMLVAPPVADASRTVVHLGAALDNERLIAEMGSVNGETIDAIPYEQTERVEVYADVRFRGQSHELTVKVDQPTLEHIAERFHEAYRKLYVQVPQGPEIQVVTVRVRRIGRVAKVEFPAWKASNTAMTSTSATSPEGQALQVKVGDQSAQTRVVGRADLVGTSLNGPLLLVDDEATAYIPPGWRAEGSGDGLVVMTR